MEGREGRREMRQEDAAGGRDSGEDSWGRKEGRDAREDMLGEFERFTLPKGGQHTGKYPCVGLLTRASTLRMWYRK